MKTPTRIVFCSLLVVAALVANVSHAERIKIEVRGQVVDQQGVPVVGASVAWFWRANGTGKKPDGTRFDLSDPKQLLEFWGHVGEMEPGNPSAKTDGDGAFKVLVHSRARVVMAMDQSRSLGAMAKIPHPYNGDQVQLRLAPLIRVRGQLASRVDRPSQWSHVYVELADDPARPIGSGRLVSCGSFDGRFEFRLPAGAYTLNAYGVSDPDGVDDIDLRLIPAPKIELKSSVPVLDLGTLDLIAAPPPLSRLKREANARGTWRDYTQHYGDPPPDWHVTDARGISKDDRIADFNGKWLLVYFWGTSCAPCLKDGIPKLTAFYEQHKSSRDMFEVVGVCIDFNGNIRSMDQLNAALKPVEKHVWKGKRIPFPVILDSTFASWERFGLPGLGTAVLIDPAGNLVKGDESTLAEILQSPVQSN